MMGKKPVGEALMPPVPWRLLQLALQAALHVLVFPPFLQFR